MTCSQASLGRLRSAPPILFRLAFGTLRFAKISRTGCSPAAYSLGLLVPQWLPVIISKFTMIARRSRVIISALGSTLIWIGNRWSFRLFIVTMLFSATVTSISRMFILTSILLLDVLLAGLTLVATDDLVVPPDLALPTDVPLRLSQLDLVVPPRVRVVPVRLHRCIRLPGSSRRTPLTVVPHLELLDLLINHLLRGHLVLGCSLGTRPSGSLTAAGAFGSPSSGTYSCSRASMIDDSHINLGLLQGLLVLLLNDTGGVRCSFGTPVISMALLLFLGVLLYRFPSFSVSFFFT